MRRRLAARRDRLRQRWQSERAVVLVWFALMLVMLTGFAGFAVDMSNWWLQAERLQRAADAGAHAGVVFLPADLDSAETTARTEIERNGYIVNGAEPNTTATVTREPNPHRLRVSVTTTVDSFFVQLLGVEDVTLTREAVAEYVAAVPMGSPQNKLGNDPEINDPGTQLWVNVSGPQTTKQNGDRYHSTTCVSGDSGCTGTTNDEYASDGYFFSMDVTSVTPGQPLLIDAFDAAYVNVGNTCSDRPSGSSTTYIMPSSNQVNGGGGFTALTTKFSDARTRYGSISSGLTSGTTPTLAAATRYCSGDGNSGPNTTNTTFIFREPDSTPWNNLDNPVINTSTCQPLFIQGYNANTVSSSLRARYIYDLLMGTTTGRVDPSDGVLSFAELFRRFTTLCTIPAGQVRTGEYLIQVRTNTSSGALLTALTNPTGHGHNRMSLRAGFGTAGATALDGSQVTLSALGRLPIYANAAGADTRFHLARILPFDAGRTLRVTLFDVGDAADVGTLQVLPPTEFASTFSGCNFTRNDNATLSANTSNCTLSNVRSTTGYNGRLVTIDVPIPDDYTCDEESTTGCWVKMKMAYGAGVNVTDATTWSAVILGNPVRIVE